MRNGRHTSRGHSHNPKMKALLKKRADALLNSLNKGK